MLVTRKSKITGITRTRSLPITQEQLEAYVFGALAQVAFPNLTPDQREFIISGITAEEWNATFGDLDSDEPCARDPEPHGPFRGE